MLLRSATSAASRTCRAADPRKSLKPHDGCGREARCRDEAPLRLHGTTPWPVYGTRHAHVALAEAEEEFARVPFRQRRELGRPARDRQERGGDARSNPSRDPLSRDHPEAFTGF